jgi:hypothetical protein
MELEITKETENVSVAQLVEAMVLVNVDVSIWSARRRMKPEDFGDVTLPPEKLATLGSKNIFDPARLDPFTRIRSEVYNFLRRNGIRFGSGFIVAETKLSEIAGKLEALKEDFRQNRDRFLQSYDHDVQEWINDPENAAWSHIIAGSVVDSTYVANRLRYRWHALKVTPAGVSDLAADVADLPNLLFEEVADCARELLRKTCADGRDKGVQKSLNPFRALRDKLEGLSFVDPLAASLAASLAEGIDDVLNTIPTEGALGATQMSKLRDLANKLASPSLARAFARAKSRGETTVEAETDQDDGATQADAFIVSLPQPAAPAPAATPAPAEQQTAHEAPASTPAEPDATEVEAPVSAPVVTAHAPVAVSAPAAPAPAPREEKQSPMGFLKQHVIVGGIPDADVPAQTPAPAEPAATPAAQTPATAEPDATPVVDPAPAPAPAEEQAAPEASDAPLTNADLDKMYGAEAQTLTTAFNVPEDLLRKAMGL